MYEQFNIPGHSQVIEKDGVPFIQINNAAATAEICMAGGHLISFAPKGQQELIWTSPITTFKVGTPIRGGIPVCWPWFSKNDANPDLPTHGFARISLWNIAEIKAIDPKTTLVKIFLKDSPESHKIWDYKFTLELTFTISDKLHLELKTINDDSRDFVIGQALHTYFKLADITTISIDGFDGKSCLNKVGEDFTQRGPVIIDKEVDEVFHNASNDSVIHDPTLKRNILITKTNSNTAVVWNPWIDKCHRMEGYLDDGYKTFVCVETLNALEDVRTVPAGKSHTITSTYQIQ